MIWIDGAKRRGHTGAGGEHRPFFVNDCVFAAGFLEGLQEGGGKFKGASS